MSIIAVASDHAAFLFKEELKEYIIKKGHTVKDFGTFNQERADYPDFGINASLAVANGECDLGIIFCGTGVGMAISANKVKGIRAVVCSEPYTAKLSRQHNDTNVLALGARVIGIEMAKMIIDEWLETQFEGGRHAMRIRKITEFENKQAK